jgi:hypothetical protein
MMLTNLRAPFLFTMLFTAFAWSCGGEDLAEEAESSDAVGAGGVTGPAFYFDGELYRTVGTPADLPTSAPDHSFDIIYNVRQCQGRNVANAGPGSRDNNGGRWQVHAIGFADCAGATAAFDANGSGNFDYASEIEAAIAAGAATDLGVVRTFVCPVIPVPESN